MSASEQDREWAIIAGGIMALLAVGALWKTRLRPWLDQQWGALQDGDSMSALGTTWDTTDLVGLGILLVVLLVIGLWLRGRYRLARVRAERRKQEKAREREERGR